MLQRLISTKKSNGGRTALESAASQGHVECLKELIAAGADINKENNDGDTALMAAVEFPNANIVDLLLSKGAEVNVKNHDGKTALDLCVIHGQTELQAEQIKTSSKVSIYTKIVYTLLQAGAKLDDTYADLKSTTAVLNPTGLMRPNTDILKMLMAAGADLKETSLFEWDESLQGLARKTLEST